VPFELLWVVVVFGVNFALWGFIGSLRFAHDLWQRRGSRVQAGSDAVQEAAVPRQRAGRRSDANPEAVAEGSAGRTVCRRLTIQDVAVLIPAHNEEETLARTIDSVARVMPRSNIYVISDASTDRTVAVASDLGVSVLETEAKAGKAGALEEGIRRFGLVELYEAVLLLDADTLLDPGYFEHALPLFDDAEVVAVAGCAHTEWNPPGVSVLGKLLISHRARIYAIMQHLIKFGQTWQYTNALYIIPGFASMYRTRALPYIDINPPGLVIEDFNMTFELYRRRLGRVGFTLRAGAVTQDPGTLGDYVRQTKRWALGFWQAVRRYRPRPDLFLFMLVLFITELLIASVLIVLLPAIILVSLLPAVFPGLLDISFIQLAYTRIDLPLVVIAVLVPDLLLSIAVALLERRPRYLLFAPAFLMLRMVDAAIGLYALPMAWAERSTGSWISPQRRRVIVADSVEVEPSEILPAPRRYAVGVDARSVSDGESADDVLQLTGSPLVSPADVRADTGAADDGTNPVPVVRAVARVPVQHAVGDRNVERYRGVVRLAGGLLSSPARVSGPKPDSSVAAPDTMPVRVRGRASVSIPVSNAQTASTTDSSAVFSGRAAVQAVNQLRDEYWSAVGMPGITVVTAVAVENLVGVAARQVPGVSFAHPDVSRPLAALTRAENDDYSADVLMHPDGQAAHVRIDLGIDYGFPVGTVVQNVRGAVLLALRSLLDVEVAAVNIVVQNIGSNHGEERRFMRRTDLWHTMTTDD
jgi:biofilm PGA synthesis N-glycosyltransferase PgaC